MRTTSVMALSALVAFAASGCMDGEPSDWQPSACAEGDGPSGNAPLVDVLQGSDRAIAERVAAAFGDPILGPDPDASGSAYRSERGTWRVERNPRFVSFFGTGDAWVDAALLDDALAALGFQSDDLDREETLGGVDDWQRHGGAPIARAGFSSLADGVSQGEGYGTFTTIEVGDLRDLGDAEATVTQPQAVDIAKDYLTCAPEWNDLPLKFHHASVDVVADSLVRTPMFSYETPDEHCSTSYVTVHVDAVTASVLGIEPSLCM